MPAFINLTHEHFGRLTVQRLAGRNKHKQVIWECTCICGNKVTVPGQSLRTGNTKSCGCLHREQLTKARIHGQARHDNTTPEYTAFHNAKDRCTCRKRADWKYYGGRGIRFMFTSFEEFYRCLGRKPSPDHELDRIDVNGHYQPGNVRWVTKEVSRQNMRSTKLSETIVQEMRALHSQDEITTTQLADKYGVTGGTVRAVIRGESWPTLPPKKPSASVRPARVEAA